MLCQAEIFPKSPGFIVPLHQLIGRSLESGGELYLYLRVQVHQVNRLTDCSPSLAWANQQWLFTQGEQEKPLSAFLCSSFNTEMQPQR